MIGVRDHTGLKRELVQLQPRPSIGFAHRPLTVRHAVGIMPGPRSGRRLTGDS
jgi:hypothetical protein